MSGWQPLIDAIGTDFGAEHVQPGPDVVERGAVRRFVEPLEFGCPLHVEPGAALAHGHPDVVAPVSSIVTFTIPPLWSAGDPAVFTSDDRDAQPARAARSARRTGLEPPVTASFAAGISAAFLRPVHAGARLTRFGLRLVDVAPKRTSVGDGAFVTYESGVRDDAGALVARYRTTAYAYEPHGDRATRVAAPPPVERELPPLAAVDWSEQRTWHEVAVGDELEPVAFPLSVYRLVLAAGATRDLNPIHHNAEVARATGAPDMYANNILLQGMWERCARQFIGLAGTIRSLEGFRMRSFNTVGDTVVVRGTVDERWQQDGEGWLRIAMRSENRHGVSVGPGAMAVTIPL